MSVVIAPLPDSIGITAVADRRQRHGSDSGQGNDAGSRDTGSGADDDARGQNTHHTAPPAGPDFSMPAETLFTTTLMATRMLPRGSSQHEMTLRLQQHHSWSPPYSAMRLRDKLI